MPNNDQVMFFLNFSTKLNKLTFFYGQTSNVADDDDEDDTQVTYRSSLPELKKKQDEEQFVFMKCVVPSQRNPLEHTFANQINILTQHMVDFPY